MLKINISDLYSHKYTEIKINSGDDLLLEKALNMRNIVTLFLVIKSVFNKNYNHY